MKKLISLTLAILTLALCIVPIAASADEEPDNPGVLNSYFPFFYFPIVKDAPNQPYSHNYYYEYYVNAASCIIALYNGDISGYAAYDVWENIESKDWAYDNAKKEKMSELASEYKNHNKYESEEIAYVTLIRELSLTRDAMEKGIAEVKNVVDSDDYSQHEADLDLIFTLDNEKINKYYKYTAVNPWNESEERKYRFCYYAWSIETAMYLDYYDSDILESNYGVVNEDSAMHKWACEHYENMGKTENLDEMPLVTFIKEFNIPRELMEDVCKLALASYKDNLKDCSSTEYAELPNLDIIYTFDNEKINEYYSIDKPYNPATGEDIGDIIVFAILGTVSLAAVTVLAKKKRT